MLRYIHRNPVKAGRVNDEAAYPWSSYGQADANEYLETREDAARDKEAKAQNVIENFCHRNGVTYAREIKSRPDLIAEICRELVECVGLTLRKTAEYLETIHHKVHEALKGE